LLVNSK